MKSQKERGCSCGVFAGRIRLKSPRAIAAAVVLLAAGVANAQNLVANPGFENPVLPPHPPGPGFIYLVDGTADYFPGWHVTFEGVRNIDEPSFVFSHDLYPGYVIEGNQLFVLNDGDSIQTTIQTTPGLVYVWSFDARIDDGGGQHLTAGNIDGLFYPGRDGYGLGIVLDGQEWKRFGLVFTAQSSTTDLTIADSPQGRPYQGLQLDAVRAIPCIDVILPPRNVVACTAAQVTLNVIALGDQTENFTYEWRRNGMPIDQASNPSAGSNSLLLAEVTITDSAEYDCVITNICGSITSDAANVTVLPGYTASCGGLGCDSDFNHDGNVDQGDIDALINVVAGGNCP